ncbi:major outer sheath C-terminal domain-containing protein, partial [Treponema pallidum]
KVEFDARWEQGRLATAPYMLITEDISSDKHFGTFVCGLKIAW